MDGLNRFHEGNYKIDTMTTTTTAIFYFRFMYVQVEDIHPYSLVSLSRVVGRKDMEQPTYLPVISTPPPLLLPLAPPPFFLIYMNLNIIIITILSPFAPLLSPDLSNHSPHTSHHPHIAIAIPISVPVPLPPFPSPDRA